VIATWIYSLKKTILMQPPDGFARVYWKNFEQVWVVGEVSNLSFPASDSHFHLKMAAPSCAALISNAAKNLSSAQQDGMWLFVRGRISVYVQPRISVDMRIHGTAGGERCRWPLCS
jgi:hypothetical protein